MSGSEKWQLLHANCTRKTFHGPKVVHYKDMKSMKENSTQKFWFEQTIFLGNLHCEKHHIVICYIWYTGMKGSWQLLVSYRENNTQHAFYKYPFKTTIRIHLWIRTIVCVSKPLGPISADSIQFCLFLVNMFQISAHIIIF